MILCEWLAALRSKFQARSLCLAGGLFLNPLLVVAIEGGAGFENVFVQPAAGNEGTALGAAWLVWHRELEREGCADACTLLGTGVFQRGNQKRAG